MTASACRRVLPLAIVLLGGATTAQAQTPAAAPPELRAAMLEVSHAIDGRLDEPAWATAGLDRRVHSRPIPAKASRRRPAPPSASWPDPRPWSSASTASSRRSRHRQLQRAPRRHTRPRKITCGSCWGRSWTAAPATCSRSTPAAHATTASSTPAANPTTPNGTASGMRRLRRTRRRLERRDLDPVSHPELQARPADLALQRAAPHSGPARDRPLGLGRPAVPGDADESRRAARPSCRRFDLGRGLSVRPAVTTGGGVPAPSAADVDGEFQPSLDVTKRLGANLLASADRQHRLRRDRGRHAPHQPDALSAVLPREADVLPRRRRHLLVRTRPRPGRPAVLQPSHRPGRGDRGADHRRRQGERPRRPTPTSAVLSSAPTIAAGVVDDEARHGRRSRETEPVARVVARRHRHRRRPARPLGALARRRRLHLRDVTPPRRQELPGRRVGTGRRPAGRRATRRPTA